MARGMSACLTAIFTCTVLLLAVSAQTLQPGSSIPTYTVTTILHEPYIMMNPKSTDNSTKYIGIVKDILDRIGQILDVNFEYIHVGDDDFGHRHRVFGNWSGMVGQLIRKEADIAASLRVTSQRAKDIHYSQTFATSGVSILLKKPKIHSQAHNTATLPFQPFTVGIWVSIIVAFVIVSLVLYAIGRLNPEERVTERGENNIATAFFMTFSMLSLQGSRLTPTSHAGRTLVCFWWIFVLVTLILYASSLTSILFLKSPDVENPLPFYTFEQMTKQSKIKYGTAKSGSAKSYFRKSSGALERQIYKLWKSNPDLWVPSIEEGVARVKNGNGDYALVLDSEFAYYTAAKTCGLAVTGKLYLERSYAFACGPDTDICRQLDHAILDMKENGELLMIADKWMSGPCGSYADLSTPERYIPPTLDAYLDVKHMDITRFTLPLASILCGVIISILVAAIEKFRSKSKGIARGARIPAQEDKQGFSNSPDIDM
ncbi:glutamate receptor U1-like [Pecten maximus]|uniref:glutamate receptor U1-like n=1 Tax=Pecten maximus TaxID=6579 RepID=UPI0014588076|nr:glutamate receptor U1-like [Pecten maximus]